MPKLRWGKGVKIGPENSDQFLAWKLGNQKARFKLCILLVILIVVFIGSFNFGRYSGIGLDDVVKILLSKIIPAIEKTWPENYELVVLYIRFPRIFAAVLIGASLSLAGAAYQAVFKNPLVSPDIMGASAGASLGAAIAIFCGMASFWVQGLSFLFALGAVALAYAISRKVKRDPTVALILSGMFISSFANAIVSLIKYMADPNDKLPAITYWLMGSLANVSNSDVITVAIPMAICAVILMLLRWRLNVLSLGDSEAKSLGIDTQRLRLIVIICATILTACSISIGGLIGWVGLVVPHLSRLLIGSNNKVLIPASMLMGGAFLAIVDDVARSITSTEIPIGVLTAIIGAPFFIFLMMYGKDE